MFETDIGSFHWSLMDNFMSIRYLEVISNKVIIRLRVDKNICGKWIMITSCNTSTKQARTFAVLLIKIII